MSRARSRQPTPQDFDPTSRVTAFYCTIAVAAVSVGAAISLSASASGYRQLSAPALGIAAIIIMAGAFGALIAMLAPQAPALSHRRFQVFYAALIVANVLSSLSQWGSNLLVRDDWGPVCLGLALLCSAAYRPAREIIGYTVQGACTAAVLALAQLLTSPVSVYGAIVVIVAVTPVLGIGLGTAAYSKSMLAGLRRMNANEREERHRHDEELRQRFIAEDSLGQLGALRSEVVPYLHRLLTHGELTQEDATRAVELSDGLRLAIVERLSRDPFARLVAEFADDSRASRSLTDRQRAAIRALIEAARETAGVDQTSLSLALSAGPASAGVAGTFSFRGGDERTVRARLVPFVRMLGFVSLPARLAVQAGETTVHFTFSAGRIILD